MMLLFFIFIFCLTFHVVTLKKAPDVAYEKHNIKYKFELKHKSMNEHERELCILCVDENKNIYIFWKKK